MKHLFSSLFLLTLLSNSFSQDSLNCEQYANGFFSYLGEIKDYYVYRDGDYQIEYNIKTKEYVAVDIEWTGPCSYTYTYAKSNSNEFNPFMGMKVDIRITKVDRDGYSFEANFQGHEEIFSGDIFVATDLKKSDEKKILKAFKKFR